MRTGILLHAFGDSFAHTYGTFNSANEKAYKKGLGHLLDSLIGRDPDQIRNNKDKAIEYARRVFNVFADQVARENTDFDLIVNEIENCNAKFCDSFISPAIIRRLTGLDLDGDDYTKCMQRNAASIPRTTVFAVAREIN